MARLRESSSASVVNTHTTRQQRKTHYTRVQSNTPSPSTSSDKENDARTSSRFKASKMPLAAHEERSSKRRRLSDDKNEVSANRDISSPSPEAIYSDEEGSDVTPTATNQPPRNEQEAIPTTEDRDPASGENLKETSEDDQYDPYQPLTERRTIRKEFRDLDREMQDRRNEWAHPSDRGLEAAIARENGVYARVKGVSEATLDARFLTSASEITHRRARALGAGEGGQGIDVDEFVGKCMAFMRDHPLTASAEGQRGHQDTASGSRVRGNNTPFETTDEGVDDDDDATGDALDWAYLGRRAAFPSNSRPALLPFLLGPLSVQKKPRLQVPSDRRARLAALRQATQQQPTVEPRALDDADLPRDQATSLTALCAALHARFQEVLLEGHVLAHWYFEQLSPEEQEAREEEYERLSPMCEDGGVNLAKFALHPTDFGQSVENLFYVSFLVRDNLVEVKVDQESGMLSLHGLDPSIREDPHRERRARNQTVWTLDYETWESLVAICRIDKPLIPDRSETSIEGPLVSREKGKGKERAVGDVSEGI